MTARVGSPLDQGRRPRAPAEEPRRPRRRATLILAGVGGLLLAAAIVAVPYYGYYKERVVPTQEPLAVVGERTVTMGEFVRRLQVNRAIMKARGSQPEEFASAPMQLVFDLIDDVVIQEGARELGLDVSSEEWTRAKVNLTREGISGEEYKDIALARAWRDKLRDHLVAQIPERQEQVHLAVIVVSSRPEAEKVQERLRAGESFGAVAADVSTDRESKERQGDYGWVPRGLKNEAWDETIFALRPGQTSEPIDALDGFYVVRLLDPPQVREVSPERHKRLRDTALQRWMEQRKKVIQTELFWNSDRYAWANAQMKQ
ncbi:MAG: peptidylprolyl isomerase [Chloroflexi bacterium]|nr:peptidylprolyl isomerase [Chloroflexota bacterium]